MTARALQRVVVRLLYDPAFVHAVRSDPTAALAADDLTSTERAWLLAVDPRAFGADRYRADRLLAGLVEEYAVAAWLLVRTPAGGELLRGFTGSACFHDSVRQRGSTAAAFGAYLVAATTDARVRALAGVEAAVARLRRVLERPGTAAPSGAPPGAADRPLRTAPVLDVVAVPAGTLVLYERVAAALAERRPALGSAAAVVLDRRQAPPPAPPLDERQVEHVLVDGSAGTAAAIRLGTVGDAVAQLLERARIPQPRATLLAEARALGADPGEDEDVVDGLVADGWLVRAEAGSLRSPSGS